MNYLILQTFFYSLIIGSLFFLIGYLIAKRFVISLKNQNQTNSQTSEIEDPVEKLEKLFNRYESHISHKLQTGQDEVNTKIEQVLNKVQALFESKVVNSSNLDSEASHQLGERHFDEKLLEKIDMLEDNVEKSVQEIYLKSDKEFKKLTNRLSLIDVNFRDKLSRFEKTVTQLEESNSYKSHQTNDHDDMSEQLTLLNIHTMAIEAEALDRLNAIGLDKENEHKDRNTEEIIINQVYRNEKEERNTDQISLNLNLSSQLSELNDKIFDLNLKNEEISKKLDEVFKTNLINQTKDKLKTSASQYEKVSEHNKDWLKEDVHDFVTKSFEKIIPRFETSVNKYLEEFKSTLNNNINGGIEMSSHAYKNQFLQQTDNLARKLDQMNSLIDNKDLIESAQAIIEAIEGSKLLPKKKKSDISQSSKEGYDLNVPIHHASLYDLLTLQKKTLVRILGLEIQLKEYFGHQGFSTKQIDFNQLPQSSQPKLKLISDTSQVQEDHDESFYDMKKIVGIGPNVERILNQDFKIFNLKDIAQLKESEALKIMQSIFPKAKSCHWVKDACALIDGKKPQTSLKVLKKQVKVEKPKKLSIQEIREKVKNHNGEDDDLTLIFGIGPKGAQKLRDHLGIKNFVDFLKHVDLHPTKIQKLLYPKAPRCKNDWGKRAIGAQKEAKKSDS